MKPEKKKEKGMGGLVAMNALNKDDDMLEVD
jgi:hypothetical protein